MKFAVAGVEAVLLSDFGIQYVKGTGEEIELPAERYIPSMIRYRKTDDKGNEWEIKSFQTPRNSKPLVIPEDKTVTFKAGPPLIIKPFVQPKAGLVQITYTMTGQAGEVYGVMEKNGKRIGLPKVTITDASGTVRSSGSFEYG
jgi:hypothetical protein